jgi:hypothetical protein
MAGQVDWTPDSKALAYLEPRIGSDIWVQPIDGGKPHQFTHFPVDGQQIWRAAWSADCGGEGSAYEQYCVVSGALRSQRGKRRP